MKQIESQSLRSHCRRIDIIECRFQLVTVFSGNSKINTMNQGIIICAGGKSMYIEEARFAASSIKSHMPKIPIALFTDQEGYARDVSSITFFNLTITIIHKSLKMHGMLNTPFERTLYLDSDTLTKGDFSELFQFLDFYDIGVTHRVKCQWPPNATPIFLDYVDHDCIQGGFLLFKKSDAARAFIKDWADEFFPNT